MITPLNSIRDWGSRTVPSAGVLKTEGKMNKYRKMAVAALGAGVITVLGIGPALAEGGFNSSIGGWLPGKESRHWKDNNADGVSTSIKFSGCSLTNGGTSGTFKYATLQLKKERANLPDPVVARNNNYCGTSSFGDVASGSYYFNYSGLNGTDQTSWHLSVSSVVVKY